MAPLVDTYGRVHRDLRVSVTDRCNSAAPTAWEGMQWMPRGAAHLRGDRAHRPCAGGAYGFDSIRLTGGEPTARAHLQVLVSKLAALDVDLALTTNGATFGLLADQLAQAVPSGQRVARLVAR